LALGFQHVAVICPYLVMVALVAEAAKLPHHVAQSAIGLAMIAVAFMTVLQSLRSGPVGSGYFCPPVVSAILSAVEHSGGRGVRLAGRLRHGDLCRRL
jgi:xanthine/uracil permease